MVSLDDVGTDAGLCVDLDRDHIGRGALDRGVRKDLLVEPAARLAPGRVHVHEDLPVAARRLLQRTLQVGVLPVDRLREREGGGREPGEKRDRECDQRRGPAAA